MRWLTLMPFLLACAACDVDEDDSGEATPVSIQGEACEHMVEGPSKAFDAVAPMASGGPVINAEHHRVDITLPASGEGEFAGAVLFEADEATDYVFFLDSALRFSVADADGNAVTIEDTDQVVECSEVAVQHTVGLTVGTYLLTFEGATVEVLGLVHEVAGGQGGEESQEE